MGSIGTGRPQKVKTRDGYRWRARWTDENGKRHSKNFIQKSDATFEIHRRHAEVERIKRERMLSGSVTPQSAPPALIPMPAIEESKPAAPSAKSFGQLCDYWITNKVPQKRSGSDDASIIRAHFRSEFGELPLNEIGVEQVDRYRANRIHLDVKTVRNHLTLLISMLNLAVDLGWLVKAPRIKKPRIPLFTSSYRYLRSDSEIQRFLRAAQAEGPGVFELYATAIYTGMRAGELAGLRKDAIDFDQRIITVKHSFKGPTKAGDVRYVPILDPLLPILREWILKTPGEFVFPNENGQLHQESARIFQEVLHRILKRAEFPEVQHKGKLQRYLVFHDLRHTFASWWIANGGDIDRLRRILGHKSSQMTQRYAHLAPSAFSSDYSRLGTAAPNLTPAKITKLY